MLEAQATNKLLVVEETSASRGCEQLPLIVEGEPAAFVHFNTVFVFKHVAIKSPELVIAKPYGRLQFEILKAEVVVVEEMNFIT